jgi:cystathionine beta-lyase/cystathionine gamma-synthase
VANLQFPLDWICTSGFLSYSAISSHREIAPRQRERMGITDGLVRLCAGIETAEDIIADLDQALS